MIVEQLLKNLNSSKTFLAVETSIQIYTHCLQIRSEKKKNLQMIKYLSTANFKVNVYTKSFPNNTYPCIVNVNLQYYKELQILFICPKEIRVSYEYNI